MAVKRSISHVDFSCVLLLIYSSISDAWADCTPQTIKIPIGNVTLSNQAVARGLEISVGNPQQSFAFLPQWPLNNSFVYGINGFCTTSWSTAACTTFRGGQYNENASKSRGTVNAGTLPSNNAPYPSLDWITENITLNTNVTMGDFPVGIALADWGEQGYHPQMAVGLGPNSTILNSLKSTGMIASRSWSMFWGRTGATSSTQMDGSFVFGGYDRAKTTGQGYTQALSYANPNCPTAMLVSITDMILDFANGTTASLFNGVQATAISACIVPDYPVLMTLPDNPFFTNFEIITNETLSNRSFGINYYGMVYGDGTPIYTGNLTINLASGLSITIPNDQLVVPDLTVDPQSGQLIANSSHPELVLNSIQQVNADDLPQLGRQFLSAAYLLYNQDASQFTLWEASPTTTEDIVAVDSQNRVVSCTPAVSPTTPPVVTSSPPSSTTSTTVNAQQTLSGGAIGGVVVGGVAGVALLCVLLGFYIRRRRNQRRAAALTSTDLTTTWADRPPVELISHWHTPQELSLSVRSLKVETQELPS